MHKRRPESCTNYMQRLLQASPIKASVIWACKFTIIEKLDEAWIYTSDEHVKGDCVTNALSDALLFFGSKVSNLIVTTLIA